MFVGKEQMNIKIAKKNFNAEGGSLHLKKGSQINRKLLVYDREHDE